MRYTRYLLLALVTLALSPFILHLSFVHAAGALAAPTLTAPDDGAMQCDSRKVTLKWNSVDGVDHYQIWLNITRDDYDFMKPGNLLDRYTKVDETKDTSFTTDELPDRWTYKWFVVAVAPGTAPSTMTTWTAGVSADATTAKETPATWDTKLGAQSVIRTFSVYNPTVATGDGINIVDGCRDLMKTGTIVPYENWRLPIAARVKDLLARMTPEEKAYQMYYNGKAYPLSGFMMGPCEPHDLDNMIHANAKTRLGIPLICAGDTIIGYQTTYPIQTGLAATRDWPLCYKLGNMQRSEMVPAGARSLLGPLAEVGTKVLYPRIQEGNGENAENAAAEVRALICGLQGGPELNPQSVMVTVKHWPGEGAGGEGGITYDAVTIKYHMIPWRAALEANCGCIMPGYAGSSFLAKGEANPRGGGDDPAIIAYLRNAPAGGPPSSAAPDLTNLRLGFGTPTLGTGSTVPVPGVGPLTFASGTWNPFITVPPAGGMGYKGLICTDWLPNGAWINAADAGSDVMGGANPGDTSIPGFIGAVPAARMDEAVSRILDAKFRMGLFENPYGDMKTYQSKWHTPADTELDVQAAREIMTLLKNDGALPLHVKKGDGIIVAGGDADDGNPQVVWTSYFHAEFGAKTILQAITERAAQAGVTVYKDSSVTVPQGSAGAWPDGATCPDPKAAIVVVGERSYTHGTFWPKEQDFLPPAQVATIQKFTDKGIPTIVILHLPRPYVLTEWNTLPNAIVADYRSGDGGGPAVAQLLFGDYEPHGRLPWQLPRGMDQVGSDSPTPGDPTAVPPSGQIERWDIPYDLGATDAERAEIRKKIDAGDPVPTNYGNPLYPYGFGIQGFGLVAGKPPVAFDLISPPDNGAVKNAPAILTWNPSEDPDAGIRDYKVYLDDKPPVTVKDTSLDFTNQPFTNGTHKWYVEATNWAGVTTKSATWSFKFQDEVPPAVFKLATPADGTTLTGADQTVSWEATNDPASGMTGYEVWVDDVKVATVDAGTGLSAGVNLALNRPVEDSSEIGGNTGANAVDGNATTRWESEHADPQWLSVDLGKTSWITGVTIKWETAYAAAYKLQVSDDDKTWTDIYSTQACPGGTDKVTGLSGNGRYIRLFCTGRATGYGDSLFEFQVYGNPTVQTTLTGLKPGDHTWHVVAINGAGKSRPSTDTFHFTIQ